MKKNKIIIITAAIAVLLAAGFYGLYLTADSSNSANKTSATKSTANGSSLQISPNGKVVSYNGVNGETALTTLKRLTQIETTQSSYGEYVTSIGGLAANSSKEYWAFYVNKKLAAVGAGSYKAIGGDKIEWKLENL